MPFTQYKLLDPLVEIKIIQLILNCMHLLMKSLQIHEHYFIHLWQLLEQLLIRKLLLKLQVSPQPVACAHYRLDLTEFYIDN